MLNDMLVTPRSKALDINAEDGDGMTPLHYAANKGDYAIVEYLVSQGASLDCQDSNGMTALHKAASNGHEAIIVILAGTQGVYGGTDARKKLDFTTPRDGFEASLQSSMTSHLFPENNLVNLQDASGKSALHYAAVNGHQKCIEKLIAIGANCALTDEQDRFAFHWACKGGFANCLEPLFKPLASVLKMTPDKNGMTPLIIASAEGHKECVQFLLDMSADYDVADATGRTALHWASLNGYKEIASLLCAQGAELFATDTNGDIPLHCAIDGGYNELVGELLYDKKGPFKALVNARNNDGFTPLHKAVIKGNQQLVSMLLTKEADFTLADNAGKTALHWACQNGATDIVEHLLLFDKENRAIDCTDAEGITPLHCAARDSNYSLFLRLLKAGADVTVITCDKLTPLHMLLKSKTSNEQSLAMKKECVFRLLSKLADPNAEDAQKRIPLHEIIDEGIFEKIVAAGGNCNAQDKEGQTPLHKAAQRGLSKLIQELIRVGANKDAVDSKGMTPLHYAAQRGCIESVKVLVESEAQLALKNKESQTAACCAIINSHADVVLFLLDHVAAQQGKDLICKGEDDASSLAFRAAYVADELVLTLELDADELSQALYYAALGGSESLLQRLIDVEKTFTESTTALHYAVKNKKEGILCLLAVHGADIKAVNAQGKTVLDAAADAGWGVEMLLKASIIRGVLDIIPGTCDKEMEELYTALLACKRLGIDPAGDLILKHLIKEYNDEVCVTLLHRIAQSKHLWEDGFDEGFHAFCMKGIHLLGFERCMRLLGECSFEKVEKSSKNVGVEDSRRYTANKKQWHAAVVAWVSHERSQERKRKEELRGMKVKELIGDSLSK